MRITFLRHSHIGATNEMIVTRAVVSFGFAVIAAVNSIYLSRVGVSDSNIGIITGAAALIVVGLSPIIPYLLEIVDEKKLYITSTIGLALIYVFMGLTNAALLAVILFLVSRVVISVLSNSAGIIFKDVTANKKAYLKAQGLAGSLMNLGWTLGPLLGGLALAGYGMQNTFFIGAALMVAGALIPVIAPFKIKSKTRQEFDYKWMTNVRYFFRKPSLVKAYIFRLGITSWWSFTWTFIPLFMINAGYSVQAIGLAMSLTQVPLFLLEFKTVDLIEPLGYRKIFAVSFGLMGAVMLLAFLSNSIGLIIAGLVFASLAISVIEPVSEIYFFNQVTSLDEEKTYPIYNTALFVGAFIGNTTLGLVIALAGDRASYLAVSVIMSIIVLVALRIKPKKQLAA